MTAWLTAAALGWVCAVLVLLLIGRDRAARREENHLKELAADLERQLAAATSALLTDLDSIEPKDFLR